ncbi:MAG: hypothetical protein Q8S32_14625 [Burkholderiaceae bacterium]|nr:hypothetical protein [Burkholderiaceae bacterium]
MKPTATLTPDGQAYDLNPTAVLLILADTAYGEGSHDTTSKGRTRAAKTVRDMLAAATAGGYTKADILETLLTMGEVSKRVTAMYADAMDAAGNERMGRIFAGMRAELKGGAQ